MVDGEQVGVCEMGTVMFPMQMGKLRVGRATFLEKAPMLSRIVGRISAKK